MPVEAPAAMPADFLQAQTVPALLAARVRHTPDAPAWSFVDGDGRWNAIDWKTFGDRVAAAAGTLRRLGIASGDRVAIMAPTSLAWETLDKGLLLVGATVVGVDLHASIADREHILADAKVSACIIRRVDDLAELPPDARERMRVVLVLEGSAGPGTDPRVRFWDELEGGADAAPQYVPAAADVATLIYTSGTTGKPKAIAFTHGQLTLACRAMLDAFAPITPNDRGACWLPLSNLFQRVMNLCSIGAGCHTFFVEDPRRLLDALPAIGPTILIGVPRLFEKVRKGVCARMAGGPAWRSRLVERAIEAGVQAAKHRATGTRPSVGAALAHRVLDALVTGRIRRIFGGRVRFMISGSAPLAPEVGRFFEGAGLPVLEAYGMSENIVPIATNRPHERRSGSVGKPLRPNEVRLAADNEVLVSGPGLFAGYGGLPDAAGTLNADGFFRTGDYGEFDEDGFLYLRGRKNDLIKTSTGRRIAPAKIEALLRQIDAVDHALVVGDGRAALIAVLALDPTQPRSQADLAHDVNRANQSLASYEQIRSVLLVPEGFSIAGGSLTSTLKPRRSVILERYRVVIDRLYAGLEQPKDRAPVKDLPIAVAAS